jgi:hypothetical protein
MDMVRLNVHFHNFYVFLLGKGSYAVPYFMENMPGQDAMAVLENPHYMVLAVTNGV